MMLQQRTLLVFLAAGLGLALGPGISAGGSWRMFHGDARHSGYSSADAPYDSLFAWEHQSGDSIVFSSPVIGQDGTLYVGNLDKELLAISHWGTRRWTFRGEGNFRASTPAIGDDQTIYIGGADGKLCAINPDSTLRWTYTALGAIKTSPNIAADGTIYFGCDDGRLYAVHPDGSEFWTYATGDTVRSSPAIGPDGTLFFGSQDGYLYALWPNGQLRWRALTGGPIRYCSPAVTQDGIVYCGSYDGFLYALTVDEEFLWAYDTGHVVRSSPAIGPYGRVYIGAGDNLIALTPDGGLEWELETQGVIYSSPVYFGDDDVIVVGSDDGRVYCVHADGSLDWTFTVGHPVRATVAPSGNGLVYAADLIGRIWALGPPEIPAAAERWEWAAGTRYLATPNPARGAVTFLRIGAAGPAVHLTVIDAGGRRLAQLAGGAARTFTWDGRDRLGRPVPPGTYFLRTATGHAAGRVTLLR